WLTCFAFVDRRQNAGETGLDWKSGNGLPDVRNRLGDAAIAFSSAAFRCHRRRHFHFSIGGGLRDGRRAPTPGRGTRPRGKRLVRRQNSHIIDANCLLSLHKGEGRVRVCVLPASGTDPVTLVLSP